MTNRILSSSQIQLIARFTTGYGVGYELDDNKDINVTPRLEAVLAEQDRIGYEAGEKHILTLLSDHGIKLDPNGFHVGNTTKVNRSCEKEITELLRKYPEYKKIYG